MPAGVPPDAAAGVFSVSASSIISAPIDSVWDVLLDFPSYSEWNSFVRKQTVIDASGNPFPDQVAIEGRRLLMSVHIPPTMEPVSRPQATHCLITHVDHDNHRVAWSSVQLPNWLLRSERWQMLTAVEGDGNKTKYETIEVFAGPVAYIVKWLYLAGLEHGFQAMADDLKTKSEQL